jgi:hypothetical protein
MLPADDYRRSEGLLVTTIDHQTDTGTEPDLLEGADAEPRPGAPEASGSTGSRVLDAAVAALVSWNDTRVERVDGDQPCRYAIEGQGWYRDLQAAHPAIRDEWDAFRDGGGILPLIDDVLGGYQGHIGGWWRAGPFVSRRRPVPGLSDAFPTATAALLAVPGIRSAMWSVMGPRAGLPEHVGSNAGALRLLFSVDGGPDALLWIEGERHTFNDGEGFLFDDTRSHRSWNPGPGERVLILADVDRPLPAPHRWVNGAVQVAHHLAIPRYRRTPARAAEVFAALNSSP